MLESSAYVLLAVVLASEYGRIVDEKKITKNVVERSVKGGNDVRCEGRKRIGWFLFSTASLSKWVRGKLRGNGV